MKNFDLKSIVIGLVIGVTGASIVYATGISKTAGTSNTKVAAAPVITTAIEGIKSASISSDKIYFNGNEVKLNNPLIRIVKDDNSEEQLYMPMNEMLEYMQFKVQWNKKDSSVNLTMNGQNNKKSVEITPDSSNNQADAKAIEIIQKTGNWRYIETYLPQMTPDGIEKVVEIYNSKHMNASEHKKASNYIKN